MGRRRKCRRVAGLPPTSLFKPQGVPAAGLRGVSLPVEGLEALRLVDAEGLSQEEAAAIMNVSRPTLCRVLAEARSAVARALAGGLAIRIEGGDYEIVGEIAGEIAAGAGNGQGIPVGCGRGRRRCGRAPSGPKRGNGQE